MDPSSRITGSIDDQYTSITLNSFNIWKTTVRLVHVQSLIYNLRHASLSDQTAVDLLQQTIAYISDLASEGTDDEEDVLKEMQSLADSSVVSLRTVLYDRLNALAEKLTQEITFRTDNAEFFDDLETTLSRMNREAAESTKREIMHHVSVAKKRLAERKRLRGLHFHRQ
ncbi:uncharacterized protein LOC131210978 [Anopheles bellator]|uniref:uncharacterized protein LOC131210978 n=1 Tax=Anopheles bellator TaxID=139047 RepID=UPI0026478DBB|nr:uncharacterized protein LOC131210978 [Anopheles bellator]